MAVSTMQELFVEELRDLYHAEKQLTKALPKMAKAASDEQLREAFTQHLEETRNQVERLEEVFELLDVAKRAKRCEAMEGLIEEGREMIEEVEDEAVLDVGLITAAQKIEHYEIAGYGSVVALAKALGHEDAAQRLAETLEEEKAADQKLNEIAESSVNEKALSQSNGSEMVEQATGAADDKAEEGQMAQTSGGGGTSRRGASGGSRSQSRRA